MIDTPGQAWCEDCQTHIPDVFEDHFEQHQAVEAQTSVVTKGALMLWAFCVAVGTLAALAVLYV